MIKRILVTAGPTRERIDPVRFLSNYSTGTLGFKIAEEAKRQGHAVTLVSGPTPLKPPGVRLIRVESALDMRRAVLKEFPKSDCIIMSAAVSDWRPTAVSKTKVKRGGARVILELVENPDILKELGRRKKDKVLVGFALETENLEGNAVKKLREKNLDIIIANKLGAGSALFGDNPVSALVIDRYGKRTMLRRKSKEELAKIVLDKVLSFKI